MVIKKSHRVFTGTLSFCEHTSSATQTTMNFSKFVPDGPVHGALIWLSGLTCTEENFMAKAGAFAALCKEGIAVYCPDTSPRGLDLPHERDHWDFGLAASFYVDATTPGYREHYRMFRYISEEFYALVQKDYRKVALSGHSMGGHGALVMGLRLPHLFSSVSAFAPITHPTQCPWGQKAFSGYLGDQQDTWKAYDTCELLKSGHRHPKPLLVDQGTADVFLKEQLMASRLQETGDQVGQKVHLRMRENFDHSYYFIATFIEDHVRFHAQALKGH